MLERRFAGGRPARREIYYIKEPSPAAAHARCLRPRRAAGKRRPGGRERFGADEVGDGHQMCELTLRVDLNLQARPAAEGDERARVVRQHAVEFGAAYVRAETVVVIADAPRQAVRHLIGVVDAAL